MVPESFVDRGLHTTDKLSLCPNLQEGCQSSWSAENKEIKRMVENKVERTSEQKRMKMVVINAKKIGPGSTVSLVVSLQTENIVKG
jgi:hypothetical protein